MTMPPLPVSLESSLTRFLRQFTEAAEERKRRAGIQQLPAVTVTGRAPSPLGIPAARQALIEQGYEPGTPEQEARRALEEASAEQKSAERTALLKALGQSLVDPRMAYEAGKGVGEKMRVGAGELMREGERAAGAARVGLGAAETALNLFPAAGAVTGAAGRIGSRLGPMRKLGIPLAAGVAGAGAGALIAPEGEGELGAAIGGLTGAVGAFGAQKVRGAMQAGKLAAAQPELTQALKTVRGDIDFSGKIAEAVVAQSRAPLKDRLTQKLVESTRPIRKLGESLEAQKLMRPSESPATRLNEAYDSPARVKQALAGEGIVSPTTYQVIAPSFADVFEPVNKSVKQTREALNYIVAKRKLGRGEEMALKMAGRDPQKLAAYKTIVEQLGQRPDIIEFEQRLNKFTDGLRQYAVDAGMWTPEMAKRLADSDALYIPFKRILEPTVGPRTARPMTGGARLGRVSATPKTMTGGTQAIENPAEALAEYAQQIIRRADAHRLTESIVTGAERMGDVGLNVLTPTSAPNVAGTRAVQQAQKRLMQQGMSANDALRAAETITDLYTPGFSKDNPVVWVMRNGQKQYFRINQPELYEAMQAFGRTHSAEVQSVVNAIGPIKRAITLAATGINWRFIAGTNPARDIPDVIAKNAGAAQAIPRGIIESVGELFGGSQFAEQIARRGGGGASLWFVPQGAAEAQRTFAPVKASDVAAQAGRVAMLPIQATETLASMVERAPRYAAAIAAQKRGMKEWGNIDDALALAARDFNRGTVDFRLKPGSPMMQFLNDVTPFLGASTKGMLRYGDFVMEQPGRAAAQAATTMAATTAEYLYSRKDDRQRYVDIIPQDRSRFLIFGEKRIPLGQEQAIVAAMTRYALAKLEQDDPDALAQLAVAVTNYLPPIEVPVLSQAAGLLANRSYAGPIESKRLQALPVEERRYESTPATFTALARSPLIPGSPRQLEYVTRSIAGPLTQGITAVTEPIAKRVLGETAPLVEERAASISQLSPRAAFTQRRVPMVTSSEQWYYKTRERAQQELTNLQRTVRGLPEVLSQIPEDAPRDEVIKAIRSPLLRAGITSSSVNRAAAAYDFREADKELQVFQKVEDLIRSRPGVTDEQRLKALEKTRALRQERYRLARQRYQDILAGQVPAPITPLYEPEE